MVDSSQDRPFVVGVDGSEQGLDAVRWGARAAVLSGRELVLVHAWVWPLMGVDLDPVDGVHGSGLRAAADRVLAEAQAAATATDPAVRVRTRLVTGGPGKVLLEESRDAAVLVVGHRGLGGFASLMLGSVGVHVSVGARCPVVVVRGERHPDGAVVVGVDGSAGSDAALDAAADAAHREGAVLRVLGARDLSVLVMPEAYAQVQEIEETSQREHLAAALARAAQRHPGLAVEAVSVTGGSAAAALVEESRTAQLVVVGTRGRGALTRAVLGSTSHAVLHHAESPVCLVRAEESSD